MEEELLECEEDEEDAFPLPLLDELEEPEPELELGEASGASNANTISLKWPSNSGSFKKASLHIFATSSVGFLNPGPRPKLLMQIWEYP